jgi:pimeloyl-ACP methyl ester carboxylesterase
MSDADSGAVQGEIAVAWGRPRHVDVDGRRMRYREAGEGPAVVLVHGLGLSADFWWRNGPELAAAGFRVLAPDLPGFGRTPGPVGLGVPGQARAVTAWADAVGLGPAAYVGHSVSAQAVLELAAVRPELVTALVLAAPTGDPRPGRLLRQAWGFVNDFYREPLSLFPAVLHPYLLAGFVRWVRTWVKAGRHDTMAAARRARVPALIVLGRRDPVVARSFADALEEALPGSRIAVLERGAHAVVFDAAEAFNREVVRFLRDVLSPTSEGITSHTESTESTENPSVNSVDSV